MTLSSLFRNTAVAVLIAGTVAAPAHADDDMLLIEVTEVASIDEVFSPISEIHTKLGEAQTELDGIEANVRTALDIAEDAPLETALNDLVAQGGDAISFSMDGTTPQISTSPEAPENIVTAVTALQTAFSDLQALIAELQTLKDDATAAVSAAQALDPRSLVGDIRDSGQKVGKTLKRIKNNTQATGQTPDHVSTTIDSTTSLMSTLTSPFQG